MTEVTPQECLRHPIWEWALDEETLPGHDETWERPIISTKDVTPDIDNPIITLRTRGCGTVASALYDVLTDSVSGISVWEDGEWTSLDESASLSPPIELIAVPLIQGVSGATFVISNFGLDTALRGVSKPGDRVEDNAPPSVSLANDSDRSTSFAYLLNGVCNGGHMCSSADKILPGLVGLAVCTKCGFRTDFEYTNPEFKILSKKYDFSETYDAAFIVSEKFKKFCEANRYPELTFHLLPKLKGFFHFVPKCLVPFDSERVGVKRTTLCTVCGQYREVFGIFKHYIRGLSTPLPEGILRSDLLCGSGNWKSPILYTGPKTKAAMKDAGLKGIHFAKYP